MEDLVVLLDFDNTLLDNDLVLTRMRHELRDVLPEHLADRFWKIYEQVRKDTDLVDFPRTMERFGRVCPDATCVGEVHAVLYSFPFQECLYPDSLKVIRHVESFASPVVLSDGDQFFQRYKIRASGVEEAVGGRVLIYAHKERETRDMQRRYPAKHYVMVDDKPRLHVAMKRIMGAKLTSVMVLQGKYARTLRQRHRRAIDIVLDGIGDLLALSAGDLIVAKGRVA
jgi:FMN phosphatase YigB (HAD superfamily)